MLLAGKQFVLESTGKSSLELETESFIFAIVEGRFKFADRLNFELQEGTLSVYNSSFVLGYDGKFSISGEAQRFELYSAQDDLIIQHGR